MKRFITFLQESPSSPCGCRHYFAKSPTAGIGSFASEDVHENEMLFPFLKRSQDATDDATFDRTDFCRLTNHSYTPNTMMIPFGKDMYAVTIKRVGEGEEFTINYEDILKTVMSTDRYFEIKPKVLRITPGFEDMHIEDDTHKTIMDEIEYFRSMR